MAVKHQIRLGPIEETLLIPLYGRAALTRAGSALIDDARAVEMVAAIDYDFAAFDGLPSLIGAVLRTRIHDLWLSRWLRNNPEGTVVEIGVGLNTRFERVDNGRARWFELDLPDAMALRRQFFADTDRRTSVAGSVVDGAWVDLVGATGGPWFLVAEAVLPFLGEDDVRRVMDHFGRFAGATVTFDTSGRWLAENQDRHDVLSRLAARAAWFCDDPATIQAWGGGGLRLVESCILPDAPPEVLALLPPDVARTLADLQDDPQVSSYRQNLFTVAPV